MREIGEKLKKARLEKGLSLEDVQKETKIHLSILKAIEGEGLTNLSPVYLRAFIKIYSKFLGFNPQELIPDHKDGQQAVPQPVEKIPLRASELKASSIKFSSIKPPKLIIKTSIYIIVGILILTGLFNLGKFISSRRKAAARENNITRSLAAVETRRQKSKVSAASEKSLLPLAQKEASGVRLSIIAKENCMVTLRVDGKMFFQGVLMKGRSESWKAKEKMELSLSNAGAVELIVNSQHFTNIGKKKQKLNNILINKEGLHIGR